MHMNSITTNKMILTDSNAALQSARLALIITSFQESYLGGGRARRAGPSRAFTLAAQLPPPPLNAAVHKLY